MTGDRWTLLHVQHRATTATPSSDTQKSTINDNLPDSGRINQTSIQMKVDLSVPLGHGIPNIATADIDKFRPLITSRELYLKAILSALTMFSSWGVAISEYLALS